MIDTLKKKSSLSFPSIMQWTTLIDTRCKEEWVTADTTVMNAVAAAERRWGESQEVGGVQNACKGIMVCSTVAVSGLPDTGEAKSWSERWTRGRVLIDYANKNCKEWEFKAVLFVECPVAASKEEFFLLSLPRHSFPVNVSQFSKDLVLKSQEIAWVLGNCHSPLGRRRYLKPLRPAA